MAELERTGLRAVIQGARQFLRDASSIEKAQKNIGKSSKEAAKDSSALDKALGQITTRFGGMVPGGNALAGVMDKVGFSIGGVSTAALAGVAAIAALTAGFLALGQRGSTLTGVADSFDRITASVGILSETLLTDLQTASAGTVSNFDLIRQANIALAGATGEVGNQIGNRLPKLLEIARVQARATGQDVNFLFQSLVTGVKRSSPLLIDNTGLVLKVGEANARYAEQLGKTVEQLTAEEKQIALLEATIAAGETAIASLGDAQETAAEKIARAQATITNTLDTLALAVQPAYETLLDTGNRFLAQINQIATAVAPIVGQIAQFVATIISHIGNLISTLLQPIIDLITGFAPYIALALRTVNTVVSGISQILLAVTKQITGFVGDVSQLPKALFEGAAAAFGSFANGIITAANTLIFPAVIGIAQFIADFLIGLSPPPKGPLSKIDKGGANVMEAWLQGVTGVSLDPVAKVAAQVDAALGSIGQFSRRQVEARLVALDAALLPFQQRLDIIKSTFDAINEPAQAALSAIERQTTAALQALAAGDEQAAATVRRLDAQREAVHAFVDAQRAASDEANLQLLLAKAQQSQERALLNVRLAQLPVIKAQAAAAEKSSKSAKKLKEETLKGGKAELPDTPTTAAGLPSITPGQTGANVAGLLAGENAVDEALLGLQTAFQGQIDTSQLATFEENTATLGGILETIGGVDLGAKIEGKFDGIKTGIENALEDARIAVETKLAEIRTFFTDAGTPGTLPYIFQVDIPGKLATARTSVEAFFNGLFDPNNENSPVAQAQALIASVLDPENENSIPYKLGAIGGQIVSELDRAKVSVEYFIRSLFDPEFEGSPVQLAVDFIDSIINPERDGSIPAFFAKLPANIRSTVTDLGATIDEVIMQPIRTFLTGDTEGTLGWIINQAVTLFQNFPQSIANVLANMGAVVWNAVAVPIINVLNGVIGAIESAIRNIAEFMLGIVSDFTAGMLNAGLADLIPPGLLDLQATLGNARFARLGRIDTALPDFLTAAMAQPQGMNVGSINTDNRTFNVNINGVSGAEGAVSQFARLTAGG